MGKWSEAKGEVIYLLHNRLGPSRRALVAPRVDLA